MPNIQRRVSDQRRGSHVYMSIYDPEHTLNVPCLGCDGIPPELPPRNYSVEQLQDDLVYANDDASVQRIVNAVDGSDESGYVFMHPAKRDGDEEKFGKEPEVPRYAAIRAPSPITRI